MTSERMYWEKAKKQKALARFYEQEIDKTIALAHRGEPGSAEVAEVLDERKRLIRRKDAAFQRHSELVERARNCYVYRPHISISKPATPKPLPVMKKETVRVIIPSWYGYKKRQHTVD